VLIDDRMRDGRPTGNVQTTAVRDVLEFVQVEDESTRWSGGGHCRCSAERPDVTHLLPG
jgi:hypothetical protein